MSVKGKRLKSHSISVVLHTALHTGQLTGPSGTAGKILP